MCVCPHCRQNAPIVYRGVNAFCTACGAPRGPLTNTSVNLAGQPSKVGGQVTRVFAWIVLVVGTMLSAGTLAACGAVVGFGSAAPFVLSVPLAILTWVLSYFLFKGGRSLEKTGEDRQRATRTQAAVALANTRGGVVVPAELARAIGVSEEEADRVLMAMAKENPEHVSIEVDDAGVIFYRFAAAHWAALAQGGARAGGVWGPAAGYMAPNATPLVNAVGRQVHARVEPVADQNVRVDARDPLDEELETGRPDAARRAVR